MRKDADISGNKQERERFKNEGMKQNRKKQQLNDSRRKRLKR